LSDTVHTMFRNIRIKGILLEVIQLDL
jgi:hypothetical protein